MIYQGIYASSLESLRSSIEELDDLRQDHERKRDELPDQADQGMEIPIQLDDLGFQFPEVVGDQLGTFDDIHGLKSP